MGTSTVQNFENKPLKYAERVLGMVLGNSLSSFKKKESVFNSRAAAFFSFSMSASQQLPQRAIIW